MFVSLNKKFIYTIVTFFLFTAILFVYTFYIIYGVRFQEEQKSNLTRNQQYLELLYENNGLRSELENIIQNHPDIEISTALRKKIINSDQEVKLQDTINREQKRTEEMIKNYDDRYSTIKEGARLVVISSILIFLAIVLLWFLIRRWVLYPLNRISEVSGKVSQGNLSSRVELSEQRIFLDEIDLLADTFNTMLKNLEQSIREIKEKESFLQSLIDGIPDGLRVIDEDYNIIIANKAYHKQIGRHKGNKCYMASQNRTEPCSSAMFACPLHEICRNHKNNVRVIQQFTSHPNRHLAINAAPLRIEEENKTYIIEVIRDLSDDIKFSHQQKLSSLGFMATSVAHEMKNHLGSIRMITENLLDKFYRHRPDEDEEKKLLSLIHNQLIECINVPERLLKLSRFSGDKMQDINCADSIRDVVALLDYEAKHNGITIDFQTSSPGITIKGFEPDFKMVLVNLILNAIKAISNNGIIKIEQTHTVKYVTIKVTDNGHGISRDNLQRIFEPFYSEGKDIRSGGTGLGLSIVKSIVEKFKGSIDVSSEVNVGTSFTIKCPRSDKK